MKTIQVSDEMHDFLMELSKEINSQDHRGTAMPYFFQIREKEQVPCPDGDGIEAWHSEGTLLHTDDEAVETILDSLDLDYEDVDEAKETQKIKDLDDFDKDEKMKELGWHKVHYKYDYKYQNSFLTAKACNQHITANHYHYNEPQSFLTGSFRNPELEKVYEFLCALSGGEIHK